MKRIGLDGERRTPYGAGGGTGRGRLACARACARALLALGAGLAACVGAAGAQTASAARADASGAPVHTERVAGPLAHPWSLAFLPGGQMLVTERGGALRVVEPGGKLRAAPVAGLPAVAARGQCGLLDVLPARDFATSRRIYWSYAEPGQGTEAGRNGVAVARGVLSADASRVSAVQRIFTQQPKVDSSAHCGGRLAWAPDGRLFLTLGERYSRKDDAPGLATHLGKVVRIEADGRVPADNPHVGVAGALPEIWSRGHRNIQGAAIHPVSGALWITEHGPQGGDEVNVVRAGANHGWPVITHGRNYGSGTRIGVGTEAPGVAPPVWVWTPSIAPSGLAFVTSDRYGSAWRGSLVGGALAGQMLVRLTLDGERVLAEERLLVGQARIRDVRQGPDGWLYLLTDSPQGEVLRLVPR